MDHVLHENCVGLLKRIKHLQDSLDLAGKQRRAAEINDLMASAGFWDNPPRAQEQVAELRRLTLEIKPLKELQAAGDDLQVLIEFAEQDASSAKDLAQAAEALEQKVAGVELQAMLSKPEDACGAYLSVQAGEGGTDASDWAAMLLRMYQRWAEDRGFATELLDMSEAEEAGIRSATLAIRGDYAFGYLKGEMGVHRLIRISPFDAAGRRQTSFAAIDLVPELNEDVKIEIDWDKDVREDVFRASGAGGQHVNKTSSAIRLTHLPTNTVVQCQNERSQHKNRAMARKMLTAKLYQAEQEKRDAELAAKRGEKTKIGFGGGTIRTYELNPTQRVKDHRTLTVSNNPGKVLDGDIKPFVESYLRGQIGKAP
ncbi:MAG: peptide chain release factor 2 [Planctomycetaceae bacterium]